MSSSALEKIIDWASTLSPWQTEAVRRLLLKPFLTPDDENSIFMMLKAECGLIIKQDVSVKKPLMKSEFSGASSTAPQITLKEMTNLKGVNAIPGDSRLKFAPKGITIVYGDNGAGKSGFARALKKACKARDISEPILSNVFDEDYLGPAKVNFVVLINDKNEINIDWVDGGDENDILSSICVFDSKCARVIIDKKNQADYLPYGTHVFGDLANLIKNIRAKLENEKPKAEKPIIEKLDPNTKAGKFYNSLSRSTQIEEIEKNTRWTQGDQKRLDKIVKEIALLAAVDPLVQAERYKKIREKIKPIAEYLISLRKSLNYEKYIDLKKCINGFIEAEKALEEASKLSLSNEPLSGAGTSSWRLLYSAAKEFSLKHAYPNNEFPYIGNDAKCVLCMQPLGQEAKERFSRFKAFMEDKTKECFEKAKKVLSESKQDLEIIRLYDEENIKERLQNLEEFHGGLTTKIWLYISSLYNRQKHFLRMIDDHKVSELPKLQICPKKELKAVDKILESKINNCIKKATPEEIKKLNNKKAELDAQKQLSSYSIMLKRYVLDLKKAYHYEQCIRKLNTKPITEKGKEIVSETLSPKLLEALSEEIKNLGGDRIPIYIKISAEYGATEHQILLDGANIQSGCTLSQILSEGEQKVIAIAGFLAEINISDMNNPIIFDDPVCSLDHIFRNRIAKRFAKEGKERQIVLFTHDLAFVLELTDECNRIDCEYSIQSIERRFETPGICSDKPPWYALNVIDRIAELKKDLDTIKITHRESAESDYIDKVRCFYGRLRETWERVIEELLLNGIVHRFGQDLQPQRLRLISDITNDDVRYVLDGWEKCSAIFWGHDKAPAMNEPVPRIKEIEEDLEKIENYRKTLSTGRKRRSRKNIIKTT